MITTADDDRRRNRAHLAFSDRRFLLRLCVAVAVVAVELAAIAWVQYCYMDTLLLFATFQVVVGGVLVFIVGILTGTP